MCAQNLQIDRKPLSLLTRTTRCGEIACSFLAKPLSCLRRYQGNNKIFLAFMLFAMIVIYKTRCHCNSQATSVLTKRGIVHNRWLDNIDAGRPKTSVQIPQEHLKFNNISKCNKKINVSFLKVHKAGSTTIMNIFIRFAQRHKLNIVLPSLSSGFGFNYLGYGKTLNKSNIVPIPDNETYNILCNHVVYNRDAFRSVMPNETTYVAIIRDPKRHFVSSAEYYGFHKNLQDLAKRKNITGSVITAFLKQPKSFKLPNTYVHNRMSFDFGVPDSKFDNYTYVDGYIKQLDKDYELVMVMEKFDESLVMLKRALCWETRDILYVPLNARHSNNKKLKLSQEDTILLSNWNRADHSMYSYFSNVFQRKLQNGGSDLKEEIKSFKHVQSMVATFCYSDQTTGSVGDFALHVPSTKWNSGFDITVKDCNKMTEPELTTMSRLIKQAWARYQDYVIDMTQ